MISLVASTARKKALKDSDAPMVAIYERASDVAKIIAGTFFLTCKKYCRIAKSEIGTASRKRRAAKRSRSLEHSALITVWHT